MPSHGCNNDIITVNPFKSQYNLSDKLMPKGECPFLGQMSPR
jgi:hypothetical protein